MSENPARRPVGYTLNGAAVPSSTYRLQLGAACRFRDVQALVPYLASLGVGAVYLSPVLHARSGSPHGYDTVDHGTLNPDLGGAAEFESMAQAIRDRGLGLLIDVVPNHMSVDPVENPAWRDVLEHGPSARHADWFDIDWEPVKSALRHKVLLPILGDQYGAVLDRGEIRLTCRAGALAIVYGSHCLPFNPEMVPLVFEGTLGALREGAIDPDAAHELTDIVAAFGRLPAYTVRDQARREARRRDTLAASERLARLLSADGAIRAFVERLIDAINGQPGEAASFDRLHTLLEHQAYRVAYWRTAFDEINYRRFFDINELAAVRMEDPRVFDVAHRVILDLIGRGLVTGLRIDHPDGLADPEAYFERLQSSAWRARGHHEDGDAQREAGDAVPRSLYVVAEKIISPGEQFPATWAIHGGTGYRFLNLINGLFVDRAGLHRIERSWARRTGSAVPFSEIAYECRRLIARTAMASEMNMLAHALEMLAAADRTTRDFTLNSLRQVLREVIASFPVYRTYVSERGVSDADRASVTTAVAEARRRSPVMDETIFAFLERVLVPDVRAGGDPAHLRFAMRVQQLTGPIQAKGLEDTAFYRYTPLLAVNEVGSHPAEPTVSVDEFQESNRTRLVRDPATMTTLTTHDTKLSGDARARLAALSERSSEWTRAVALWSTVNAPHRVRDGGARWPAPEDEYQLYQALLAIWPAEPDGRPVPVALPEALVARLESYLLKAVRESKRRSSWLRPNHAYERAVIAFARAITRGAGARRFLSRFVPFARLLARHGAMNSLSQLVLWLASPGVPDVYQGTESWHLQLVDPDNRAPVDFGVHVECLTALDPWLTRARAAPDADVTAYASRLVADWTDGTIKTWCMATGLRHRRHDPALFIEGAVVPLMPDPPGAPVVGLARVMDGRAMIAVVPRLAGRLAKDGGWPIGAAWRSATLAVPAAVPGQRWCDRLTARQIEPADSSLPRRLALETVFAVMPCAWLEAN